MASEGVGAIGKANDVLRASDVFFYQSATQWSFLRYQAAHDGFSLTLKL
jgi:hypothetical protein